MDITIYQTMLPDCAFRDPSGTPIRIQELR
jgi:hypothetical protein